METTKKPPQTKANVIACFEAIQKSEIKNQKNLLHIPLSVGKQK